MFEELKRLGTPEHLRAIVVQTRRGQNIENVLGSEPSYQCELRFKALLDKHRNWYVRKGPQGGYNCAGAVWASRRTCLPDPKSWLTVLADDGYREIPETETELGDVIVYYSSDLKEPLHIGRICKFDEIFAPGFSAVRTHRFPRILSKLDNTLGEVIHAVEDLLPGDDKDFQYRFYTDRQPGSSRCTLAVS